MSYRRRIEFQLSNALEFKIHSLSTYMYNYTGYYDQLSINFGDGVISTFNVNKNQIGQHTISVVNNLHHEYEIIGDYNIQISGAAGFQYQDPENIIEDTSLISVFLESDGVESYDINEFQDFIGASCFMSCINLIEVKSKNFTKKDTFDRDIEYGNIRSIKDHAFDGCSKLKNVSFLSCAYFIGEYAFNECHDLTVNCALTSDDYYAFHLRSLGDYAFNECSSMSCFYSKTLVDSILGDTPGISSLGVGVFKNCTSLEFARVPLVDIHEVPNELFSECSSLRRHEEGGHVLYSVMFPGSAISAVGDYAFYNCKLLTPPGNNSWMENVEVVGQHSFDGASGYREMLTYGTKSLKKAGPYSYANIMRFGYELMEGTAFQKLEEPGHHMFYGGSTTTGAFVFGQVILSSLPYVSQSMFEDFKEIKSAAFDAASRIESSAFKNCSTLEKFSAKNATAIGTSTFENCTSLSSVSIPKATDIGNFSFYCAQISSIDLPNVQRIGNRAFEKTPLQSFDAPASLTAIGDSAFFDCTSLTSVNMISLDKVPSTTDYTSIFVGSNQNLAIFVKPSMLEAFQTSWPGLASKITPVYYTSGVKPSTFENCTSLSSLLVFDDSQTIYEKAFKNCTSLKVANLPANVSAVNDSAYEGCISLKTFTSSNRLKAIGNKAFFNDKSLIFFSKMKYSSDPAAGTKTEQSLKTVGEYAFANTGLQKIDLNLVPTVGESWWGDYCFASCQNLTDASFYYSTYMSNHMFDNCKNLRSVDYSKAYNVNNYVGRYVFNNCSSLSSVTFSDQQFSILQGFFQGCTSLKKVDFFKDPSGKAPAFKYVQKYAFANCSSLEEIEFPASIKSIDQLEDSCLSGCQSLKKITFSGVDPEDIFPYSGFRSSEYNDFPEVFEYGRVISIDTAAGYDLMYDDWETGNDKTWDVEERRRKGIELLQLAIKVANQKSCPVVIFTQSRWVDVDEIGAPLAYHEFPDINFNFTEAFRKKKCIPIMIIDEYGQDYNDPEHIYKPKVFDVATFKTAASNKTRARQEAIKSTDDHRSNYNYDAVTYVASLVSKDNFVKMGDASFQKMFIMLSGATYLTSFDSQNTIKKTNRVLSAGYTSAFGTGWEQDDFQMCIDTNEVAENVLSSGFLRACHDFDVTFCNELGYEEATCRFRNDPSKVIPFVQKYEYPSDKETLDNFKTAKQLHEDGARSCWYYNSKEVYEYAKAHHIPVLFIYSKVTCTPCQAYGTNIHEDEAFQKWIEKQDFICCRMEAEKPKGLDRQMKWCDEVLGKKPRNYARDGHPLESFEDADFNAFGNIGQDTSVYGQHYFHGFYTKTQLQNPTFVFYYFKDGDVDGKETAYHGYSFHNIINVFNSVIGVQGMEQLLKSLCLWHFDNNSLEGAQFVHDAGKAFVKEEYDIEIDNPYEVDDNTITLDTWIELKGKEKTAQNALEAMKNVLSKIGSEADLYPEYIGDCLWGDIEWIEMSFDNYLLMSSDTTPAQMNAELARKNIIIGDGMYKLQISDSDVKQSSTPCAFGKVTLYRYSFVAAD